jgi:hypothetical protein
MLSRPTRARLAIVALLSVAATAQAQHAEPNGGPDRVKDLFGAANFAECVEEARHLLAAATAVPSTDTAALDKTRTYLAACLILEQDVSGGRKAFEEAVRAARQEHRKFPRPNTLVFPPPVVSTYDQVYGELEEEFQHDQDTAQKRATSELARIAKEKEAERERQARLIDFATEESVVVKNQRWVAAVPFGVGQFQNRKPALGWLFLVSEALALATTVAGITYELDLYAQSQKPVNTHLLNSTLHTVREVWVVSAYALIGLASLGVAEAQLDFVPEFRETRRRELPPNLRPNGSVKKPAAHLGVQLFSPAAGGAGLGLVGRF